jgi:AcrR family transcriptional regulator
LEQGLLELLEEERYETISIQQITDQANVGRATFYLHYNDKEQLLLATLQRLTDEFERGLPALVRQDFLTGNRTLIIAMFQHVLRSRRLCQALLGEHGQGLMVRRLHTHPADQLDQRGVAPWLHMAGEGVSPLVPASFLASYLSGALIAAITRWLDHDCLASPEEMAVLVQNANRPVLLQVLGFNDTASLPQQPSSGLRAVRLLKARCPMSVRSAMRHSAMCHGAAAWGGAADHWWRRACMEPRKTRSIHADTA